MPGWAWGLVVVIGLVLLDRLAIAAEARGWINWRRRARAASGGVFGELMDAFQPSRRIVTEERQRQHDRVDQQVSGSGVEIDLEARLVQLRSPRSDEEGPAPRA